MSRIVLIDYDMGNLHSVEKALAHIGYPVLRTQRPLDVISADAVILPGVGGFGDAMKELQTRGLDNAVKNHIGKGKPFLGICLGLQLLFEESEEGGSVSGLGILKGRVVKFRHKPGENLKIPHMGWNEVTFKKLPFLNGSLSKGYFYFVHSYYAVPEKKSVIIGTADYPDAICAALLHENIFAVQFHPEKSQKCGLELLKKYLKYILK